MSHMWMSHVARVHASGRTHKCVVSHTYAVHWIHCQLKLWSCHTLVSHIIIWSCHICTQSTEFIMQCTGFIMQFTARQSGALIMSHIIIWSCHICSQCTGFGARRRGWTTSDHFTIWLWNDQMSCISFFSSVHCKAIWLWNYQSSAIWLWNCQSSEILRCRYQMIVKWSDVVHLLLLASTLQGNPAYWIQRTAYIRDRKLW